MQDLQYLQQVNEDLAFPPTLEGEVQRLNALILQKDGIIESFEQDGEHSLFWALNRKQNEIARSLNSFVIDLTVNKDDKSFERYNLLMKGLEDHVKSVHLLRQQYLKIPEDKMEEMEAANIPPIERRAKKQKT